MMDSVPAGVYIGFGPSYVDRRPAMEDADEAAAFGTAYRPDPGARTIHRHRFDSHRGAQCVQAWRMNMEIHGDASPYEPGDLALAEFDGTDWHLVPTGERLAMQVERTAIRIEVARQLEAAGEKAAERLESRVERLRAKRDV